TEAAREEWHGRAQVLDDQVSRLCHLTVLRDAWIEPEAAHDEAAEPVVYSSETRDGGETGAIGRDTDRGVGDDVRLLEGLDGRLHVFQQRQHARRGDLGEVGARWRLPGPGKREPRTDLRGHARSWTAERR